MTATDAVKHELAELRLLVWSVEDGLAGHDDLPADAVAAARWTSRASREVQRAAALLSAHADPARLLPR